MDSIPSVFVKDFTMKRSDNKPIHAQARKIAYSVYQYFTKESLKFKKYTDIDGSSYFRKVQERVAAATGISRKTVCTIISEAKTANNKLEMPSDSITFRTPRKGTSRKIFRVVMDKYDYDVIRKTVYDFHMKYHELPTLKSLTAKLCQTIDYKGSDESIRRVLLEMGMRFYKKVLVEKHDVRLKRIEYLEKIRKHRAEGKNIVYIGETTIDLSACENGKKRVKKQHSERLIVVHAGNEVGFVPGAFLMYEFTETGDDYQNYEKWLHNQLIPNIPPNSVLVIEDISNNNKYIEKPPNSFSTKQEMITWLGRHDIPVDPTLLKPKIYAILCHYKEHISDLTVDKIFTEQGHTTLRLPPYHAELNPIENVWSHLKGYVAATNKIGNMTKDTAKILLEEKICFFGAEEWKELWENTIKREEEFVKEEHALDEYLDKCVKKYGNFMSDNESNDTSDSEMEVELN